MGELKFKKGDWCFCEFKLQQIQETQDNRITCVSDGMFSLSSNDLSNKCFPLDMKIKQISDTVDYWSNAFHNLNNNSLNYPDLNRALISKWIEMCENKENENLLKELYLQLNKFGKDVTTKVKNLSYEEIDGINLFR